MKIEYEQTWCDYLTKCQYFNNLEVGGYDCYSCKYFGGFSKSLDDKHKFVECNYVIGNECTSWSKMGNRI